MRLFILGLMFLPADMWAEKLPPRIQDLKERIVAESEKYDLNPALIAAIVTQESSGKVDAREYSHGYQYLYKPAFFADKLRIPLETEIEGQRTSYGLMQMKCATARYLGFIGVCQNLFNAAINMKYGVKYLAYLKVRYKKDPYMVSAYNQGHPYKNSNGQLNNYRYVNSVLRRERMYRKWFQKPISNISVNAPHVKKIKTLATTFEISRLSFPPVCSTNIDFQAIP